MSLRRKLVIVFIFLTILTIGLIFLITNGGYTKYTFINSTEAVDRIRTAEKLGSTIQLSQEDINSILGVYIGKGRISGGVTIAAVNITLKKNFLTFKIPIVYKGIHLLISTRGKCTYLASENKIQYEADYYKVGSIPIPKKIVEDILKTHDSKDFEVSNSSIKAHLAMFPFSIKSVVFNEDTITLALNKKNSLEIIFPKLPEPSNLTDSKPDTTASIANSTTKVDTPTPKVTSTDNHAVKPVDNSTATPPVNTDTKSTPETKNSLSQINNELTSAISSLEGDNEKEVLRRIMATINAVNTNPSYNYYADVNQVTSLYSSLSQEARSRVKLAIMSNVDMDTAMKLKNTFGL